ncbi:MAG: hypothetical protein K6F07_02680 [Bacilli bacterium]|nr:hypothetical protein [Bacilli bacterium]
MKKFYKYLSSIVFLPLLLSSCSFFGSGSESKEENSDYDYNQKITFKDEDGTEYYLALEFDEMTLVDEQSAQLRVKKIRTSDKAIIGYQSVRERFHVYTVLRNESDVASIDEDGLLTGLKKGTVDVEMKYDDTTVLDRVKINVIYKELQSLEVAGFTNEYLIDKVPNLKFSLKANFNNDFSMKIANNAYGVSVDKSQLNYQAIGTYPINVSYYYKGVTKSASFNVSIVSELSVEYKKMDITYTDLFTNNYAHYLYRNQKNYHQ